ncbi:thioester domain-containing protein [Kitasatospora sp. NPDC059827]|uniref:thioester domain-containing protein n=1 Tax=Kitasatospora sp. NPDC059827 TaxID=3346964 RepID=UPI00365BD4D7
MLATGVLAVGGLTPTEAAAADGRPPGPGVYATVVVAQRLAAGGGFISFDGKEEGAEGGLMAVTTNDDSDYLAYSLDARSTMKLDSPYDVGRWSDVPTLKGNPDAGKVNWILQHGYPAVPVRKLQKPAGGTLTPAEAATATQAAIWRVTNHVKGVLNSPVPDRLVDYLVSQATDVEEPDVALSLSSDTVTGEAGSLLGPIRVTSTADEVYAFLDPVAVTAGAALTDRAGKVLSDSKGTLIDPVKNGDSLFVKAPTGAKPGSATVHAAAAVPVKGGLALVSPVSQPLILLPTHVRFPTTASKGVSWTAPTSSPSPTATPSHSVSPSASPTTTPTTTPSASQSPSATPSASASTGPSAVPSTTPSGSPSATPGGALAATGAGGGVRFAAAAGIGLLLVGGVLVLLNERRRRRRYGA